VKRVTLVSNLCIAVVLIGLGAAVFTADITGIFISVSAPVSNGNRQNGQISIMFVVEEDNRFLPEILEKLKDKNIPATFFIGGNWASNNRETVKDIAMHFEIGNHAWSNRSLARLNERDQLAEISQAHTLIREITGERANLFLPPNASFNNRTLRSAERLEYRTIMWSRNATQGIIFDKAVYGITSGDFVMFRPSLSTYAALPSILNEYTKRNLQIVSLSKHL